LKQLVLEEVGDPVGDGRRLGVARPDEDGVHPAVMRGEGDVLLLKPRLSQQDDLKPVVERRLVDVLPQGGIILYRRFRQCARPPWPMPASIARSHIVRTFVSPKQDSSPAQAAEGFSAPPPKLAYPVTIP